MRSFSNVDQLITWQLNPDTWLVPLRIGSANQRRGKWLRQENDLEKAVFPSPTRLCLSPFYFFSFVPLLRSLFLLCLFWLFFSFLSRYLAIRSLSPPFPFLKILFFFFLFSPSLSFLSLFPVTLSAFSLIYSRCSLSPFRPLLVT